MMDKSLQSAGSIAQLKTTAKNRQTKVTASKGTACAVAVYMI